MFKEKELIPVALVVFLFIGSALNAATTEYWMDFAVYDGVTSFDEDDVDNGIDEGDYVFCHDSDGAGSDDVFVDFVLMKDSYNEGYTCVGCGTHHVDEYLDLIYILIDLHFEVEDVCVVTWIKFGGQEYKGWSNQEDSIVISKAAESGRTLAHEIGHNAGLGHWSGSSNQDKLMYLNEDGTEDEIIDGTPDEKAAFENLTSPD